MKKMQVIIQRIRKVFRSEWKPEVMNNRSQATMRMVPIIHISNKPGSVVSIQFMIMEVLAGCCAVFLG